LLHTGRVIAPWSMFVADQGDEVHVTTERQRSPHQAIDVERGREGIEVQWRGGREGTLLISGRERDLTSLAKGGGAVTLSYRIDRAPEQQVKFNMRCSAGSCGAPDGAALDLTAAFKSAPPHQWRTLDLPLACLGAGHADLENVEAPFALTTAGRLGLTIADIRLHPLAGNADARCP
jgi:beta-glucosidase